MTTLASKKTTKTAISQNIILRKWRSPKSLPLLHFSIKFSETFRIDVNMDFAKILSTKSKKPGFFRILVHFLLQGLTCAALGLWTQNHPQVDNTYPGDGPQPIAQKRFSKSFGPDPPPLIQIFTRKFVEKCKKFRPIGN